MTRYIIFAVMGAAAWGQQRILDCPTGTHASMVQHGDLAGAECVADSKPAPLKCVKWEHVERTEVICNPPDAIRRDDWLERCKVTPTFKCAPDMHTVTEKEWQELMEKMKKLENALCYTSQKSDGIPRFCFKEYPK